MCENDARIRLDDLHVALCCGVNMYILTTECFASRMNKHEKKAWLSRVI